MDQTSFIKLHFVSVSVDQKFHIIFLKNHITIISVVQIQLVIAFKAAKRS